MTKNKKDINIDNNQIYVEPELYAKLGDDPIEKQPKGVWKIDLEDFLKNDNFKIDPITFFVTTGEAIKKAEALRSRAYSIAAKANVFYRKLSEAKNQSTYLETNWANSDTLLVRQKEPRNKEKAAEIRAKQQAKQQAKKKFKKK